MYFTFHTFIWKFVSYAYCGIPEDNADNHIFKSAVTLIRSFSNSSNEGESVNI